MIATVQKAVRSDFARHGLLVFVATMSINVLGYAYHFAISRRVGVEQYGVLAALNAAYMIGLVASSMVGTVVVKYAAEFRATGHDSHLATLVRRLALYGWLAAFAIAGIGALCAPAIGAFLKVRNITAIVLCFAIIGLANASGSIRSVFSGIEDFGQFAVSAVMESGLKAVLGIAFVFAGWGVAGAFGGWAIGSFTALTYTSAVLLWRYRAVTYRPLFIDVRRLVTTTAGVSAATLLLTSISYADVIVVKHFADATTSGLYGALSLSGKILFFFISFVPIVLLPKASNRAIAGHSVNGILFASVGVVALFSACGLVVYDLFPSLIITTLAGKAFAPGAPYVFSYGIAMALLAGLSTVVYFKIGIHRFDFLAPLALCAAGELMGIAFFHSSLREIIDVLIAGNAIALVASSYRIWVTGRPATARQRPAAA